MIKMIVFDMAGTTVDEDNVVYKTLQKAINEAGYNFTLNQVLAEGAGKEKSKAVKDILKVYANETNPQLIDAVYQKFLVQLKEAYDNLEVKPQKDAEELFKQLQKRKVWVVLNTGYNSDTARSLLVKLGWKEGDTIDALITASDVPGNRPEPDMILLAMQKFGITDGAEVAKVGDSIIDIEEGRNAGCSLCIGITTGAHTPEQLASANPDYIINNMLEILPVLDAVK